MDDAVSGLLQPEAFVARCAEPQRRVRAEREPFEPASFERSLLYGQPHNRGAGLPGSPWARIGQALRVTDLLLQAGGFGAIVLDMGSLAPEHVTRIPLATWFRYRAAAERTQASVLLLTQYACAKSSAGLVLRLHSGEALAQGTTVLAGFERRIEIDRQQLTQGAEKVVPMRKPPQRAGVAMWRGETTWAGRR